MSEKKLIIAIDGPAGAGKSTVSKLVAKKMGYLYIDSGAMYRAIAWKSIKKKLDLNDNGKIVEMANKTDIVLKPGKSGNSANSVFVDGEDITHQIRTEDVSQGASKVSKISEIRKILQEKQRSLGKDGGAVMEGRDIGTVVFPNADYKFYLDASNDERAMRRYKELKAKGENVSLESIKEEIVKRDERDKNRQADPLKKAKDAIFIDGTELTIEETADAILNKIRKKEANIFETTWLYYLGRFLFRVFFKIIWRWKIYGHDNVPLKGGVIMASNHSSFADPPLVGSAMKRPLFFMAKIELFEVPILGFLIKRTNAFPVRRGEQDVSAFRKAQKLLKSGNTVLVFPEGTRSRDGNFGRALPGVGMLSCLAGVPVVPVRIVNSDKLNKILPIKLIFGKTIYPPKEFSRDTYQKLSEKVLEEIKNLH
ncbi:MAG: (d)CMP kinase [Endomicrobiales bacterium]|nr:(d)CMP kinase [Endomicrobiales bacterium]